MLLTPWSHSKHKYYTKSFFSDDPCDIAFSTDLHHCGVSVTKLDRENVLSSVLSCVHQICLVWYTEESLTTTIDWPLFVCFFSDPAIIYKWRTLTFSFVGTFYHYNVHILFMLTIFHGFRAWSVEKQLNSGILGDLVAWFSCITISEISTLKQTPYQLVTKKSILVFPPIFW